MKSDLEYNTSQCSHDDIFVYAVFENSDCKQYLLEKVLWRISSHMLLSCNLFFIKYFPSSFCS